MSQPEPEVGSRNKLWVVAVFSKQLTELYDVLREDTLILGAYCRGPMIPAKITAVRNEEYPTIIPTNVDILQFCTFWLSVKFRGAIDQNLNVYIGLRQEISAGY